jgi:hypothetical protein
MVDMIQGCLQPTWSSGNGISGVSVCAKICDPVSPQNPMAPLRACPAGFGCYPHTSGASYCMKQTGIGVTDSYCLSYSDCAPGYICLISISACAKYCFTNRDCPLGMTCYPVSPSYYAGFSEVGYCY